MRPTTHAERRRIGLQRASARLPPPYYVVMLPNASEDPRSDTTALVVAVTGVIGPVPYLMAAAALRMAGNPRRSRQAAAATVVAAITIALHTALLVWLAARVLS
jgi:hypothetical protein